MTTKQAVSYIIGTPARMHLIVPIPPSLNNVYTNGRGHGRRVLTEEGRSYKERIGWLINELQLSWQPVAGERLGLTIRIWFPNRRRRDLSNAIKILEDAMAERLGFDDCMVDHIEVWRMGVDAIDPRCEVFLEAL